MSLIPAAVRPTRLVIPSGLLLLGSAFANAAAPDILNDQQRLRARSIKSSSRSTLLHWSAKFDFPVLLHRAGLLLRGPSARSRSWVSVVRGMPRTPCDTCVAP